MYIATCNLRLGVFEARCCMVACVQTYNVYIHFYKHYPSARRLLYGGSMIVIADLPICVHVLVASPNIFAVRSNCIGMYAKDFTLLYLLLSLYLNSFSIKFVFGSVNIDLQSSRLIYIYI